MGRAVRVAVMTVVLVVVGVASALATVSGAVDAVDWACRTLGALPVYLAGAFLAGVAITHGVHRATATGSHGRDGRRPPGLH